MSTRKKAIEKQILKLRNEKSKLLKEIRTKKKRVDTIYKRIFKYFDEYERLD